MKLVGHLAVGWLAGQADRPNLGLPAAFSVFGALVPDIVDKTAKALLLTPWSRWYGHALVTWICVGVIYAAFRSVNLTVSSVTFDETGTHFIEVWQTAGCGEETLAALTSFVVVDDEDGDGLSREEELCLNRKAIHLSIL